MTHPRVLISDALSPGAVQTRDVKTLPPWIARAFVAEKAKLR